MTQEQSVLHNCGTCKFFFKTQPEQGLCRRFPPEVIAVGQDPKTGAITTQGHFPPMQIKGWCGEYLLNIAGLQ